MRTKTGALKVQAMTLWGGPVRASENWRQDAAGEKKQKLKIATNSF